MTQIIQLSKGLAAFVDDEDKPLLDAWKWYANKLDEQYVHAQTTMRIDGKRKTVLMSRFIWEHHYGPIPPGVTVDHIEHGTHGALDNRKSNLQLASRSQQRLNTRKSRNSISRYRYVTRSRSGKWFAQIGRIDRYYYLGTYDTEVEAAIQADRACYILFGDTVRLNFPELKDNWKGLTLDDLPKKRKKKSKLELVV